MLFNDRILFILIATIFFYTSCKKNDANPVYGSISVSTSTDTIGGIITITGSGFSANPGDDSVFFNDTARGLVLSASTTQLAVEVPAYTTEGPIIVKTASRKNLKTQEIFKIAPKFLPQSESVSYPIKIITGGGSGLSDYTVSFNGTITNPTSIINDELTVAVPAGATIGKVTVNYKNKPYTSLNDFTVLPAGTVTTVTSQGAFTTPRGLAFDANGNILICDLQAGVINKVDPASGAITLYAGNGSFSYSGGSPLPNAGIYGAINLALAPNGNIYSTNSFYGNLMKFTIDSAVNQFTSTQLISTNGIFIDDSGNIYVTDAQQVKKITPGGIISVIAGQGSQGFQNAPALSALFLNPTSIISDGKGNILVCDETEIRLISNNYVSTFAGGGGNGEYMDGTAEKAGFLAINDIVRDPATGNFFATDPGSHLVRMISPLGVVTTIAGDPGQEGNKDGAGINARFSGGPWNIAIDKNENIYVTDGKNFSNGRLRKIVVH